MTAVAATMDGRYAVSGSEDRTLRLWDINEGVCRATLPLESPPLAIAVAPDARSVVVRDRVGNLHHFQIHFRGSEVRMDKIKVLLFAANPRGTAPLDLPREFREIDEEVGAARSAMRWS